MKFYRRHNIDPNNAQNNIWAVESDGRIRTTSTSSMETPVGPAISRPEVPVNGSIRYNTSIGTGGELEAYINGQWEIIKTNRHATVTKQDFENGDYADTIFGPLAYDIDPSKAANVFVYVENVFQLPDTNYSLVKSTAGNPLTTSTVVTRAANFGDTVIKVESIADFNVGLQIAGNNLTGNLITATSSTDGTITISPGVFGYLPVGTPATVIYSTGTFIKFASNAIPVPYKPVIALLGLDGYCPPFEV